MNSKTMHQLAGQARSESMTPAQRKALASKAAHARWNKDPDGIAVATHEGNWNGLLCAVLKDGRRVFSERSLSLAFAHVRSGSEYKKRKHQPEGERLPVFVPTNVAEFLSPAARERLSDPVRYRRADGFSVPAYGVEAELIPELCDAFLAARRAGVLVGEAALRRADAAEVLLRGIAKVGIVALVDEATGYQVERERGELQRLLEKYVSEEFRPYTAMFPTEFYRQMFRLRGIATEDVRKRPAFFGRLTNDIVYERMLPGMLERLREVNPADDTGRRSRKHHQHLTENQGVQHLRDHLNGVVYIMKACSDWPSFMRMLNRASPKRGTTLELPFAESDGE